MILAEGHVSCVKNVVRDERVFQSQSFLTLSARARKEKETEDSNSLWFEVYIYGV